MSFESDKGLAVCDGKLRISYPVSADEETDFATVELTLEETAVIYFMLHEIEKDFPGTYTTDSDHSPE